MIFYRESADVEFLGDFRIALALYHPPEHAQLAFAELINRRQRKLARDSLGNGPLQCGDLAKRHVNLGDHSVDQKRKVFLVIHLLGARRVQRDIQAVLIVAFVTHAVDGDRTHALDRLVQRAVATDVPFRGHLLAVQPQRLATASDVTVKEVRQHGLDAAVGEKIGAHARQGGNHVEFRLVAAKIAPRGNHDLVPNEVLHLALQKQKQIVVAGHGPRGLDDLHEPFAIGWRRCSGCGSMRRQRRDRTVAHALHSLHRQYTADRRGRGYP